MRPIVHRRVFPPYLPYGTTFVFPHAIARVLIVPQLTKHGTNFRVLCPAVGQG